LNLLVVPMFFAVTFAAYLAGDLRIIPGSLKFLPELCSAMALVVVVARLVNGVRVRLDWRYGLFLCLLLFIISFGFFAQSVDAGPIVGGLRFYLKALPFLLLPAVYSFTERQVKVQAMWLFLLMAVQVPLAFYQKYFTWRTHWNTGDGIYGSVLTSGALSLLMLCGIAALVAMYLRDKLRLLPFVFGVGFLLAPTTINETKITILLLPLVMLVPALFMPRGQSAIRKLVPIVVTGAAAAISFVAVYAYFAQFYHDGMPLMQFFQDKKTLENYLYNKANKQAAHDLGRFDTLVFAYRRLEQDPLVFGFGVGAGNASTSAMKDFEGKYAKYYKAYGVGYTQVGYWMWELGFAGVLAYLFFFFVAFRDAVFLARSNSSFSPVGQAWATILVIYGIALGYQASFGMDSLLYPFWFYSGLCASKAWELRAGRATAKSRLSGTSSVRAAASTT
jgi:hypothetical protein